MTQRSFLNMADECAAMLVSVGQTKQSLFNLLLFKYMLTSILENRNRSCKIYVAIGEACRAHFAKEICILQS